MGLRPFERLLQKKPSSSPILGINPHTSTPINPENRFVNQKQGITSNEIED